MSEATFVIVGAGLAGARAAEALRKEGFDGRIVLLGDEPAAPYERPPLTKDFLRGESDRAKIAVKPDAFYVDNAIELRTGTAVTALDLAGRAVVIGDAERIGFDRLLLATGSRSRPLGVPGADLPGVHLVRQVDDAEALRAALGPGRRLLIVGGGWIGTEVAASAREVRTEVTVLMTGGLPLEKPLGPEAATVYRDLHVEHGVTFVTVPGIASVEGAGRAEAVVTTDGRRFEGDAVVAAVGASARTELASAAGLATDGGGVSVSDVLETSVPGIFAAGDIAAAWYPALGARVRLEHWAAAKFQGPAVARSMLGRSVPYDRLPYFYSDQYDVSMEYTGFTTSWDRVVVRGDLASRSFVMFYVKDGRVAAAMNVNVAGVGKQLDALIRSSAPADDARLADPDVPLDGLAAAV